MITLLCPFLLLANESGVVTLWHIPSEGLTEMIDKPSCRLVGVWLIYSTVNPMMLTSK